MARRTTSLLENMVAKMTVQELSTRAGISIKEVLRLLEAPTQVRLSSEQDDDDEEDEEEELQAVAPSAREGIRKVKPSPKPIVVHREVAKQRQPPSKTKTAKGKKPIKEIEVETRTPAQRKAYDAKMLQYLREAGRPIGAREIRNQVGGTALQVRTSLNRLIDAGEVHPEGVAASTTYEAVES